MNPRSPHARRRRALFFALTFLSSGLASALMFDILRANGLTALEGASLALFFILFTWIAGAFWTAVFGFCIRLRGRDRWVISARQAEGLAVRHRVAIVMPVYNEDTTRVMAGLTSVWSSLAAEPEQHAFDLFILSDTRKEEIAVAEELGWREFVARHNAAGRVFYRRRTENTGRKAGNIADFVRRWGAAYESMIVLDADSIMTGHALVTLARLIDAHPQVGLIQTAPLPAGRETLFARYVQFAAHLNGPMLSSGLAFWQLGEANYWGHNAIIRLAPFATACALPRLPGHAPLGGEILSHDFVEAAFMRRAGYQVWLVPDLEGSWEEVPSNIIDYAARDRRWAQGNMQHLRVIPLRGLNWLSRLHMLTGVLSYATSPMWFAVLIITSIITCQEALQAYQYFQPGTYTLFPTWPEYRQGEIVALLGATVVVLLLPKTLGTLLALCKTRLRRGFGGGVRLIASLFVEQIFSMLLAPPMMVFHSSFVVSTLAGRPVAWNTQERGDRGVTFREALARHRWHVLLGLVWGVSIWLMAPKFIWWILPVIAGLILSVPLTMISSHAGVGRFARRCGLLLTPEEVNTPWEIAAIRLGREAEEASARAGAGPVPPVPTSDGTPAGPAPVALPEPAPLTMEAVAPVYVLHRRSARPPLRSRAA
jgi:membrane glycosyltransferase